MSTRKKATVSSPLDVTLIDQFELLLKRRLDPIMEQLTSLSAKLDKTEQQFAKIDQQYVDLSLCIKSLDKDFDALKAKCVRFDQKFEMMESYTRRKNLRLLGLPQGSETGKYTDFFANLLVEIFGKEFLPTPPELERVYRYKSRSQQQSSAPPVVLTFDSFYTKDLLIKESRKRKSDLQYNGHRIRLVQDYSPGVFAQRAEFKDVLKLAYDRNLKPSLRDPAKLRLTLSDGGKRWFSSPLSARNFIDGLPEG